MIQILLKISVNHSDILHHSFSMECPYYHPKLPILSVIFYWITVLDQQRLDLILSCVSPGMKRFRSKRVQPMIYAITGPSGIRRTSWSQHGWEIMTIRKCLVSPRESRVQHPFGTAL